jgi:hypothetical protein
VLLQRLHKKIYQTERLFDRLFLEKRKELIKKTSKSRESEKGASTSSHPIFFSSSTLYHKRNCMRSYISTKHGALSKALFDNEGVVSSEEEPYQTGPKKYK